jgi:4-amino-4-deoxy-L-arabinose transferase-like glycosyltransferase
MLGRERRASMLYMIAFYALCAVSFMAKGIPGFTLPALVAASRCSRTAGSPCCSNAGCASPRARWCCS